MRGTIRERKNKDGKITSYQVILYKDYDQDTGVRNYTRKSFKNKKEAEKYLASTITAINRGETVSNQAKTKFKTFAQIWLQKKKISVKPSTYSFYEGILGRNLIPVFGTMELSKIKPIHIQKYLNDLSEQTELSPTSIHHFYKTIRALLNDAVKMDILIKNPCLSVTPPKITKPKMRVYNLKTINQILEYAETEFPHMVTPIMLAAFEGLRRGEISALEEDDFGLDTRTLKITKNLVSVNNGYVTGTPKSELSNRSVTLTDRTYKHLIRYPRESKYLAEKNGNQLLPNYITKTWNKITKALGLEHIRFHDLRHSHATILLEMGVHPKIVSERLGHTVDMALSTYSHVTQNMQKSAVNELDALMQKS